MALINDRTAKLLTPDDWIVRGKVRGRIQDVSVSTQYSRRAFLAIFARANGTKTASEVIAGIKSTTQLYKSAQNVVEYCKNVAHHKPGTIADYRNMMPGFFTEVFGKDFDRKAFEEDVPSVKSIVSTVKAEFDRDMLVGLLKEGSTPRDKALLYFLSYGFRIGEILSRKFSDLEDKGEYTIVKLWSDETKTRESRRQFVSKECMNVLRSYHATLREKQKNSLYLFPGETSPKTHVAGHLSKVAAGDSLKKLFISHGLKDTAREIFSPHGLRTFAENQMREAGLNDTFTKQIVGHSAKTEDSYKGWQAIEKAWVAKCLTKMTWLRPTEIALVENPETRKELDLLKAKVTELTTPEGLLKALKQAYIIEGSLPGEIPNKKLELAKKIQKQLEDDQGQPDVGQVDDASSKVSN